jgi:hypothetical protein
MAAQSSGDTAWLGVWTDKLEGQPGLNVMGIKP